MNIIGFDGPTSVGKTTQINMFLELLKKKGHKYLLIDEHGGIRDYINSFQEENYYKKDLGKLTETFLWFAHYANRIENAVKEVSSIDYLIFDRFIFTPVVYQYILLNIENKLTFNKFSNIIQNLFYSSIDFTKGSKVISVIFTADINSLKERFISREHRILNDEEESILERSIVLYNNLRFESNFETNNLFINTSYKKIEVVHSEIINKFFTNE